MRLEEIALPSALACLLAFLVILPLVRQRLRTGRWALVVRNNDPGIETFVRWWTVVLLLGVAIWSGLVVAMSTQSLGVWSAPAALGWSGVAFLVLGFVIVAISQAQMGESWRIGIDDEPTELVTTGLYRWVRHPIYTGILSMFVGVTCLTPSAWTLSGLVLGLVVVGLQSRLEEEHVKGQHQERFQAWAARAGRFLPGIGRLPRAQS